MNPSPATHTVLVVDDEIQIRRLLRITLEAAGFTVLEAESGRVGLEGLDHRGPRPRARPQAVDEDDRDPAAPGGSEQG